MIPIRGTVTGVSETVAAFSQLPSLLRQAAMAAMTESSTVAQPHGEGYLLGWSVSY